MPRRGDVFAAGQYYHIYNRGVGGARLFYSGENYEHCLRLLKRYAEPLGAAVIAYCLMPNHYHLLLKQEGDEPLSGFVGVVFNAYVQALNVEQERRGPLFEGRFHHIHVDRDDYVLRLCAYIHLNPVKAGLVPHPEDWPYSNYRDWIGLRAGTLKDAAFIRQFWARPEDYRRFLAAYYEDEAFAQYLLE